MATWERVTVWLGCGCRDDGDWKRDEPGDECECERHGATEIVRVGRVRQS